MSQNADLFNWLLIVVFPLIKSGYLLYCAILVHLAISLVVGVPGSTSVTSAHKGP